MQSRALTTSAQILTQLNNPPMPFSCTSVSSINIVLTEDPQDKLNAIADQASNFGFGCVVILRKMIDNEKQFCTKLKTHFGNTGRGVMDILLTKNVLYTAANHLRDAQENAKLIQECEQHVSDMENDLKSLTYTKK